ncbi:MAG: hypothetical protein EOM24_13760 [Chloroflexia bacterium]|nr:hypothetical protein [Chloroflexia bacterium]
MDFFTRFKWAVPTAFADTLSICQFIEGDVLHEHKDAYLKGRYGKTLQVKYPAYGSRQTAAGSDGPTDVPTSLVPDEGTSNDEGGSSDVNRPAQAPRSAGGGLFESNWRSEVRVVLYDRLSPISVGQIRTTQGRLYTALWKGDLAVLREEYDHPDPPMPIRLVTKRLARTHAVAAAIAREFGSAEASAEEASASHPPVFVMVQDAANAVSREKHRNVSQALGGYLLGEPRVMEPEDAGLADWDRIAPTTHIAFFVLDPSLPSEEISEIIKGAVYAGNAGKFRLAAHGVVFDGAESPGSDAQSALDARRGFIGPDGGLDTSRE